MEKENFIILDTETTGLDNDDEVIELSIINQDNQILLNKRFKPLKNEFKTATKIHGIDFHDLKDCPLFIDSIPQINNILSNYKKCYIYNSAFDIRLLEQTANIHNSNEKLILNNDFICVMDKFSLFTNDEFNSKLEYAFYYFNPPRNNIKSHSALGDCQMTLFVVNNLFYNDIKN